MGIHPVLSFVRTGVLNYRLPGTWRECRRCGCQVSPEKRPGRGRCSQHLTTAGRACGGHDPPASPHKASLARAGSRSRSRRRPPHAASARPAALRPAPGPPLLPQDAPLRPPLARPPATPRPPRPRPSAGSPQAGCRRLRTPSGPRRTDRLGTAQVFAGERPTPRPSSALRAHAFCCHQFSRQRRSTPPAAPPRPRPPLAPPQAVPALRRPGFTQNLPAPPRPTPRLRPATALRWSPQLSLSQEPSLSIPVNTHRSATG